MFQVGISEVPDRPIRSTRVIRPGGRDRSGYGCRRNCVEGWTPLDPEHLLVDEARLLAPSAPETMGRAAGMGTPEPAFRGTGHGVLTDRPGVLSADFFTNLVDTSTAWVPVKAARNLREGYDRKTGREPWTAIRVDLVFGANARLRAVSEVYGADDANRSS